MIPVVIVEDDPMVSELNRRYIEKATRLLRVTGQFRDGQSALNYLEKHGEGLVILDVYMPVMNGLEVLQKIRGRGLPVDVIMVTAADNAEEFEAAFRLGVLDYLVKPFDFERFAQAIQRFLTKQHLMSKTGELSQKEIDALLAARDSEPASSMQKGLHEKTLEKIASCLEGEKEGYTCEEIAAAAGLSAVTVRRYLNYMVEQKRLYSTIDYNTGGRPKMIYKKENDEAGKL